jgi:hypothetical protein
MTQDKGASDLLEKAARTVGDDENVEGYRDGFDLNSPEPSLNRSARYRHSFECGRADREGRPAYGGLAAALEHADRALADDIAAGMLDSLTGDTR